MSKYTKAFWEGFQTGFTNTSKYGIPISVAFALGIALGNYAHPYETCKRMYEDSNDIMECVWIKENP